MLERYLPTSRLVRAVTMLGVVTLVGLIMPIRAAGSDVVFTGDSVTSWAFGPASIGSPFLWPPEEDDTSYPQLLAMSRPDLVVANIAVAGETSKHGHARLRAELPAAEGDARIYIMQGANDPLFLGCGYRVRRSVRNVLRQARRATRLGYAASVMTLTPVPDRITPQLTVVCGEGFWAVWRSAYNERLVDRASRRRWRAVSLVDLGQLFTEEEWTLENGPDLHPRSLSLRASIADYLSTVIP